MTTVREQDDKLFGRMFVDYVRDLPADNKFTIKEWTTVEVESRERGKEDVSALILEETAKFIGMGPLRIGQIRKLFGNDGQLVGKTIRLFLDDRDFIAIGAVQ